MASLSEDPTVDLTLRFGPPKVPLLERWLGKVIPEPMSGCWLWLGALDGAGYGMISMPYPGPNRGAHRVGYELFVGPIPDGMHLDHLCRTPGCVNPGHLEPVTPYENSRRGNSPMAIHARKTECIHGHSLTPENVYTETDKKGRVSRKCRICRRAHREAFIARQREKESVDG